MIEGAFWALLLLLIGGVGLLVLAGMASAALEVRREKRAGVPVTRPAWEARAHRRATGGTRAALRGYVKGLRR